MRVQTFRSEFAIERFNDRHSQWASRPGEVQRDIALISPQVEIARDELGALIDPDCLREHDLPTDLFEYLHNIRTAEGEPSFDCGREARERVNDREYPQLAPGRELIMDEVHGPGLVWSRGRLPILPRLGLDPALRCFVAQLQAHLAVLPVDPVWVGPPPLTTQQHMDTTIAVTHARLANLGLPRPLLN